MCLLISGCASDRLTVKKVDLREVSINENQFVFGAKSERLDKTEARLMAPRNWIRKLRDKESVAPPFVRDQTPAIVVDYLSSRNITGINVDVDLYQPKLQWQRLKEAKHVGPIVKYSFGTLNHLRDAILPARVFNQDRYNHFTKTLSINSHDKASSLYEAAMANEHLSARFLPAATVIQRLPLGATFARTLAAKDALKYSTATVDPELEAELYPVVYRSVVSEALGDVGVLTGISMNFPQRIAATIGASGVGKIVGDYRKRMAR